jgi:hypothetical protein
MEAVREAPLEQVAIQTIHDGNKSSHFHPIRDSIRIYKTPLLYIIVALLSEVIDLGFFTLFTTIGPSEIVYKILGATITSRLLSGAFNFTLEYFLVFENEGGFAKKLGKYALIFFLNMGLSFGLTYAFNFLPANLTFIKLSSISFSSSQTTSLPAVGSSPARWPIRTSSSENKRKLRRCSNDTHRT